MRDVYAVRYGLTAPRAFELAQTQIADWCLRDYQLTERPNVSDRVALELGPTDAMEWSSLESSATGARAWNLLWRHRDHEDPSLGWRVLVQLTEVSSKCSFTLRLSQESLELKVRPAIEVPGRPRIVRDLARGLGGEADGRPVNGACPKVLSDDIGSLTALLLDQSRRLPVVVTSLAGATLQPACDPADLADQLIGIAHVFSLATVPASFDLTYALGRSLSVFDGAIRIYWPGLTPESDPFFHRLWLAGTVEALDRRLVSKSGHPIGFSQHLRGLIGDVAALRVPPDPLVGTLLRESEERAREEERARRERLIAEATNANAMFQGFSDEFDAQTARIHDLEKRIDEIDQENDSLKRDNEQLRNNWSAFQAAIADEPCADEEAESPPGSIPEALERLAAGFPEAIVVLEAAKESAADTRYGLIPQAYDLLMSVGRVAQRWRDGTLNKNFDAAFEEDGLDYQRVSGITQGRYPEEYERTYGGERVKLGPHVGRGRGGSTDTIFRVYWFLDERERRFVIGHVGRHLTDSTT